MPEHETMYTKMHSVSSELNCAMNVQCLFQVQIVSHDPQLIKLLDVTNESDTHYRDKTVS